jgi:integrase
MPHYPKPFFRKSRGLWYVQLDGKQHNLGADRDAAFAAYRDLMATPKQKPMRADSLALLIDQFLGWVEKNRAPDTYIWYQSRLQLFVERYPVLRARDLKPFHVQQWIDDFDLSSGSKRNYARSIIRCLNWCEEQGLIDRSPLRHFKKPKGGRREVVVSAEQFASILDCMKRPYWQDLVRFAWYSGARAAEILAIEKRHVDLQNHRIVFPVDEEKMERIPRIIYLNGDAEEIIRRLMAKTPAGPLFRNFDGVPWTTDAVNCAFVRVRKKLGVKFCLTTFRHTFAQRLLTAGVDALTVSVLMGHSDTNMLARVYSHLSHAPAYLLETVKKVG